MLDPDEVPQSRFVLADGRCPRARRSGPVRRVVVRFAIGTALALVVVLAAGYVAGSRLAEDEALAGVRRAAEGMTRVAVEPHLDGLLAGEPGAQAELDAVVRDRLLPGTMFERVKVWTPQGQVLYCDETPLVGRTFPLRADQQEVLRTGATHIEVSELAAAENSLDRSLGSKMVEVYTLAHAGDGSPLLFEGYVAYDVIAERRAAMFGSFAWAALVGLLAFAVVQTFLAFTNLRWLQRQRARLLDETARIGENERRRVARDLHDGVVQDLIGASLVVDSAVEPLRQAGRGELAEALVDAGRQMRGGIRGLRSMIIDITPAGLRSAGLVPALRDLVGPLQARGTPVRLEVPEDLDLPPHVEAAIYRAAQEALRNASRHARSASITLAVEPCSTGARLVVRDDGPGFDPAQRPPQGHVGLRGLADMTEELGGMLAVATSPRRGTELVMELPT